MTHHEAGTVIATSADSRDRVWFVVTGAATVLVRGSEHHEIALDRLGPWELFGGTGLVGEELSWPGCSLVAAQPSEVLPPRAE